MCIRDSPGLTRGLSLVGSIAGFLVTIPLYTGFDSKTAAMQFVEKTSWIEAFNVNYHLGIDGISLWFVLLTAFITIIVVLAGWEVITSRVSQYTVSYTHLDVYKRQRQDLGQHAGLRHQRLR